MTFLCEVIRPVVQRWSFRVWGLLQKFQEDALAPKLVADMLQACRPELAPAGDTPVTRPFPLEC